MEKNYIGALEINNGSVIIGNAEDVNHITEIGPIYRGVYHCYTYEEDGKKYVGIEYGGSLDQSNDFTEMGKVQISKKTGIFETSYYKVYKNEKLAYRWDEKLNNKAFADSPVVLLDNRGMFVDTRNEEAQEATVFARLDKKSFFVEIKMSYVEGVGTSEPMDCIEEIVPEECSEAYCAEENQVASTTACGDYPEEVVDYTQEEVDTKVYEANATYSQDENNLEEEVEEYEPTDFEKYLVEKLYYPFDDTDEMLVSIKDNVNEIITKLLNGNTPPTIWHRGMTVEVINGTIHKITFDFD